MSPWMDIAALIVGGFIVLLIAPTLHRRINARSREAAESKRVERAATLRDSNEGTSRRFESAYHAVKVRDRLLIRGVRAEIVAVEGPTTLIYKIADEQVVLDVMAELGID